MAPPPEQQLSDLLRQRIDLQGPMTVAEFMYEALQHPRLGYYNRSVVLGRQGDFVTAPEISQIFGELLGLWMLEQWQTLGEPTDFALIELGPGKGTLLSDLLRITKLIPAFNQSLDLHLVESSKSLRAIQKKQLRLLTPTWHEDITTLPNKPALILANEYFDALPIRQFAKSGDDDWREILVGLVEGKGFGFIMSEKIHPSQMLAMGASEYAIEELEFIEVSPATKAQVSLLASHLKTVGGSALFIDYGYVEAEGYNSLQAVRRHQKSDLFDNVGSADLTAHVDFGFLRNAFDQMGLKAFGPVEQGSFLTALGLATRLDSLLQNARPGQAEEIQSAAKRLIAPYQMGKLFKVLAVSTHSSTPAGFPV